VWSTAKVKPPHDRHDTRVFTKLRVQAALEALKHADQHPSGHEWVPGELECRTSRDLTSWLARRRGGGKAPRIFYSDAACVQPGAR
jgi:hypothetical protein